MTKIENRKFKENKILNKLLKKLKIKFDIFKDTKNIFKSNNICAFEFYILTKHIESVKLGLR
jgi:hypothetical protein